MTTRRCPSCGEELTPSHRCGFDAFSVRVISQPPPSPDAKTEPGAPNPVGEPTRLVADPLLPDVLGGYRLDFVIGAGGMGTVYRAHDERVGTPVAVKVMKRKALDDPHAIDRSLREIAAVSRVHHPAVNPVLQHGQLGDGRVWFASPFLEGRGLDALLLERRRLAWPLVVPVLAEVAGALAAAHGAGVVHRDVKPGNIFLSRQSDGSVLVKLLDFGLALLGDPAVGVPQTSVHSVSGTAAFVAPEQALGQSVGAAADLYALGITAFLLLTGRPPFSAGSNTAVMRRQVFDEAPPVGTEADVPRALERLVGALLAKRPRDRPASASAVRDALEGLRFPPPPADGLLEALAEAWARKHPPGVGAKLRAWWTS